MRTANAERVIAIPKRRDFSDCFMGALLARSLAPMREVRPSRASRGSPVWRAPVASFAADGRAMGPSYYGSCVTPYFGPGLARGCTGFRRRAIRGRRRGRPPATRGIRPRPRQRVFRNWTTPAMASSTSSTDVGLPDAEHHGNLVAVTATKAQPRDDPTWATGTSSCRERGDRPFKWRSPCRRSRSRRRRRRSLSAPWCACPRQHGRHGPVAGLLHQIAPQLARTAWVAQLPQRHRLDLADPLAAHVELCADLLERAGTAVLQPEPELEHSALTSRQRVEHGRHLLLEQLVRRGLGRGQRAAVLDEVAEMGVLLLADRRIEGERVLARLDDLADLLRRDHDLLAPRHRFADLLGRRFAAQLLEEGARDSAEAADRLQHVDRDADRARLVGDRAGDRLPDPPLSIGGELEASLVVEFLDRPDQADVALLQEVEKTQPAADVLLGDRDDEAQVRRRQLLAGVTAYTHQHPAPLAELGAGRHGGVPAHLLKQRSVVPGEDPALEGRERDALAGPVVEGAQAHVVA